MTAQTIVPCLNKFVAGELAITNECANKTERKGWTERLMPLCINKVGQLIMQVSTCFVK